LSCLSRGLVSGPIPHPRNSIKCFETDIIKSGKGEALDHTGLLCHPKAYLTNWQRPIPSSGSCQMVLLCLPTSVFKGTHGEEHTIKSLQVPIKVLSDIQNCAEICILYFTETATKVTINYHCLWHIHVTNCLLVRKRF
jgi:hypothetical protein